MQRSRAHASIRFALLATAVAGLACSGHGPGEQDAEARAAAGIETVDDARLRNATSEPESWLTYGGSYAEQRYSRLDRIDATNVGELGLAWSFETNTYEDTQAPGQLHEFLSFIDGAFMMLPPQAPQTYSFEELRQMATAARTPKTLTQIQTL